MYWNFGRIIEKYESQEEFAKVIGISSNSMSKKMNGKTGFSQKDIVNWSDSLGISKSDYGEYFLIKKLNDVKPKVY